jgi:hypothetical protein
MLTTVSRTIYCRWQCRGAAVSTAEVFHRAGGVFALFSHHGSSEIWWGWGALYVCMFSSECVVCVYWCMDVAKVNLCAIYAMPSQSLPFVKNIVPSIFILYILFRVYIYVSCHIYSLLLLIRHDLHGERVVEVLPLSRRERRIRPGGWVVAVCVLSADLSRVALLLL